MVLRIPIDTQSFMGSSLVIIIPNVMANHLSLQIESSEESFTFVDCSKRNSGGIVRNLETPYNKIGDDPFLIAVCYSDAGAERESDSEASIDTQPEASFDNRFEATIDKNLDASVGSWAGEDHVESFVFLLQEGRFV
ncbi:hypothetical protein F2Q70_00003981 [Brassica cretica]|uniref:Uncharacterized protein n=1 Tax=Brassica cretica TaxID=69181 RepID=A0A8S9J3J9_BRACR|nr:hypothetical protein F2Q70_00003981 [Brassica cretica]